MTRITREMAFMECAAVWAKRSTCYRGCVGCVIVRDNNIISIGYNGAHAGQPHCAGMTCPRSPEGGCDRARHAEANALMRCNESTIGADMYVTTSPCVSCAVLIEHHHISRVFYSTPYRDETSLVMLHKAGIVVRRLTPNGMLINPLTNELLT